MFDVSSSEDGFLFAHSKNNSTSWQWRFLSSNRYAITMEEAGAIDNVIFNSMHYGDLDSVMITTPNDGNFKILGNAGETTAFNGDAIRANNFTDKNFVIGNIGIGSNSSIQGLVYSIYIWHRELTDAEALSVNNDPYQFLVPA
jgi:hypothetical protein